MYRREARGRVHSVAMFRLFSLAFSFLAWVLERSIAGQHSASLGSCAGPDSQAPTDPRNRGANPRHPPSTGGLIRAALALSVPALSTWHRPVMGFGFVGRTVYSNLRRWAVRTWSHTGIRWLQVGQSTVPERITNKCPRVLSSP